MELVPTSLAYFCFGTSQNPGRQWLEFLLAASLGFSVNWGSYKLLTDYSSYFMEHSLAAFFTGVCFGTVFNYALSKMFVFRPLENVVSGENHSRTEDVGHAEAKP